MVIPRRIFMMSQWDIRPKNMKKRQGFTIVELLIYMGILSIVLVVLTQIFTTIVDFQLQSQSVSSVQQDGRFIMSRLQYDINRAQTIVNPALGTQSTQLTITINGTNYQYSLSASPGNMQLNDGATDILNSYDTNVSNLTFTHFGNATSVQIPNPKNAIKVSFTITSKIQSNGNFETKNFESTIGIR